MACCSRTNAHIPVMGVTVERTDFLLMVSTDHLVASGSAWEENGSFERNVLMRVCSHFAFFIKEGRSTVNQSQTSINGYEFGA
jgi:hypothetical protein